MQRLAGLCHTEGPGDEAVRTDCCFIFLFFCLFFAVCAFTSTQDLDSVHVVSKEEQRTRVYTVLYCHVITKKQNKKTRTGLLSQNVTLIFHQRRQKRREEMPRFLVVVLL